MRIAERHLHENTFIDLTPVFSYVSLTFARNWLISTVWDLVQLGAVLKLNSGLRLIDPLFTVFTVRCALLHGLVWVCMCAHPNVTLDAVKKQHAGSTFYCSNELTVYIRVKICIHFSSICVNKHMTPNIISIISY